MVNQSLFYHRQPKTVKSLFIFHVGLLLLKSQVFQIPNAKASITLGYLRSAINSQQSTYPEAAHINLKAVLLKFEWYAKCAIL